MWWAQAQLQLVLGTVSLVHLESLTLPVLSTVMPVDLPAEGSGEQGSADADEKKKQQRRGRKKSKLEDMFPAYLQVGLGLLRRGGAGCALQGQQQPISL